MADKRLIDANVVINDIQRYNKENFNRPDWSSKQVCELLKNAAPVEAVPVVRCADCKKCSHDTMFGTRWCHGHEVKPDDFCSRGERSEGE